MRKDRTHYIVIIDGHAFDRRITLYGRKFNDKRDALRFFHNLDMHSAYEMYQIKEDEFLTAAIFEVVNRCGEMDVRLICSCMFCG